MSGAAIFLLVLTVPIALAIRWEVKYGPETRAEKKREHEERIKERARKREEKERACQEWWDSLSYEEKVEYNRKIEDRNRKMEYWNRRWEEEERARRLARIQADEFSKELARHPHRLKEIEDKMKGSRF